MPSSGPGAPHCAVLDLEVQPAFEVLHSQDRAGRDHAQSRPAAPVCPAFCFVILEAYVRSQIVIGRGRGNRSSSHGHRLPPPMHSKSVTGGGWGRPGHTTAWVATGWWRPTLGVVGGGLSGSQAPPDRGRPETRAAEPAQRCPTGRRFRYADSSGRSGTSPYAPRPRPSRARRRPVRGQVLLCAPGSPVADPLGGDFRPSCGPDGRDRGGLASLLISSSRRSSSVVTVSGSGTVAASIWAVWGRPSRRNTPRAGRPPVECGSSGRRRRSTGRPIPRPSPNRHRSTPDSGRCRPPRARRPHPHARSRTPLSSTLTALPRHPPPIARMHSPGPGRRSRRCRSRARIRTIGRQRSPPVTFDHLRSPGNSGGPFRSSRDAVGVVPEK